MKLINERKISAKEYDHRMYDNLDWTYIYEMKDGRILFGSRTRLVDDVNKLDSNDKYNESKTYAFGGAMGPGCFLPYSFMQNVARKGALYFKDSKPYQVEERFYERSKICDSMFDVSHMIIRDVEEESDAKGE